MKSIAVISLTERGRMLSKRLREKLPDFEIRRFCFRKHTDENAASFESLSELTADIFSEYDGLIYIGACGITVRVIAPHIVSKQKDPAVIVLDERGQYVISLLSGHLGGANALSNEIADAIGAQPIITTATDIGGQFSPDSFAAANHLLITDIKAAKEIAAAVLEGEKIGLHCAYPYRNLPQELFSGEQTRCGIVIADIMNAKPNPVTLHLIPQSIVLGIGCKKGISAEKIAQIVNTVFTENHILPERICKAASIDLKANEAGLVQLCKRFGISLQTYSAKELMQVLGDFSHSDFAEKVTGADNICERSAVLCSGGSLVIRKTAQDGVTVAAAEIPVEIDFEKRML